MDLSENGEGSGHSRSKPQAQDVDINPPDPEQQIPCKEIVNLFPESIKAQINSTARLLKQLLPFWEAINLARTRREF